MRKIISKSHSSEIIFSDGEVWVTVRPNNAARGYRWRKAWIDVKSTSIYDLYMHILPYGDGYKLEDEIYFNW